MAFAGLYDVWTRPDGEPLYSFAIITKDAEGAVATLHHRMPVMLAPALERAWLDPEHKEPKQLHDLLAHSTYHDLDTYPVSRRVNTPSSDDPSLIQPLR
jgi:putative SOS response-associated peptidase YedK